MDITSDQIRAARALLGWRQEDLAERTGVTIRTLTRIEKGETSPRPSTAQRIREALEAAGVVFLEANGLGPGVRFRGEGKPHQG